MQPSSPKLSAPALQRSIVPTPVLKEMSRPDLYDGHWLVAGPGAGKTQIARMWVEQLGRPYAWLQLDPQDEDPLVLVEQLRLALTPLIHPRVALPRFAPQSGISLPRHCEYLWQMFLDALRAPCVIVLDDAHQVQNWPQHPVMQALIEGLDARAHLLVLSRSDLDDRYVRQVLNRRIKRIEPALFQWQAPQLKSWIERRWGLLDIEDATIETLLDLSQGRAAILALLDIKSLLRNPGSLRKRAAQQLELSELMESSLLAQLDPQSRESLFWLACLGSFPSRWLHTFGFPNAVQACVRQWQQNSSVVSPLEKNPGELRFHSLFAEILRGSNKPPPAQSNELLDRIIDACTQKGRHFDAIALCRHTQSWHRYWDLLKTVGLDWLSQGQIGSLRQALADLPDQVREALSGPTLSLFLAANNIGTDPTLAYQQGLDALTKSDGVPELRNVWAHALATTANAVIASGLDLGSIIPVLAQLNSAIEAPWFTDLAPELRLLALGAGLIASMSGDRGPAIRTLYEQTERAMLECDNLTIQATTVSALSRVVLLHGISEFAESIKQQILRVAGLSQNPETSVSLMHAKTMYHITSGSWQKGLRAAHAVRALSSSKQPTIWSAEVLACGAFCAANMHDLAMTRVMLKAMLAACQQNSSSNVLANMHTQMYVGALAAHEGRWEDALAAYTKAKDIADCYRYSLMQVGSRACLGIVALELGRIPEAKEHLAHAASSELSADHPLNQRLNEFSRMFISLRSGTTQETIPMVRSVLERFEQSDSYLQVAAMLPQYTEFLSFALTHQIKPELVKRVIRRGPIYPSKRPHLAWPSYIDVRVLGRFEIYINGQNARKKLVSSGRRFELLTALLWCGGADLGYEQCIKWIWNYIPDRARAIRSIKTALKRLNDDFGRDDAILDEQGKISINPELWSYDALQLQQSVAAQGPDSATINLLWRGFLGPTPIPPGMRKVVPSRGDIDLGPAPLLSCLGVKA